ncbi:shikimate dehydrogenase [Sinorhizobium terangae]|uniref:Shikimate dehydrogenase n=1 Tax=Sinorhizobium terangae TaxID=110322 RepID=A0A6N7LN84_SINTE|nr:shikimate dehydrogenase [Sinorhizobium terangae]MBB4188535.1 shikimate dehydrogenase [Sinorhizobium terangae]MQX18144.1 shikimate dehydrogenase [Sinorhizobium terangae]
MSENLRIDGASRIYPIIGDPISQVKSPAGMTAAFAARGVNAVVVPIHTSVDDVDDFIRTAGRTENVDGIIVTIPHKFVALTHCSTATERARITDSINVLSRNPDGTWHGEIFDGLGMLGGIRSQGGEPSGKKTLLVGAGGAGIAIAQALLEAGVRELAIHDVDINRRDHVITRMREFYRERVHVGSDDPAGFELVVNATPMGMRPEHPFPVQIERLSPDTFVACVITAPAVSPWLAAAREKGCRGSGGVDMYTAEQELMLQFFLNSIPTA